MTNESIYQERVTSQRTETFFAGLTILLLILFICRVQALGLDVLAIIFLFFACFFFFYWLNYRTLLIYLTRDTLQITFGVFKWAVPLKNIEECCMDRLPWLLRYGGAGIHFMMVHGRYRASFNFLEFPRVVVRLRRKVGLVRDISFSTNHSEEIIRCIQNAISTEIHADIRSSAVSHS